MSKENYHRSVLNSKVLEALNVLPNEVYLDATLGGAGHTEGILKSAGKVVAIDVDKHAIEHAKEKFGLVENDGVWVTRNSNLKIIKANFKDLDKVLEKLAVKEVSGILFDLGVSSHMFDSPERGFSFSKIGPLDMRMDQSLQVTAEDLVNGLNEGELYELFTRLGEVVNGRSIARNIVRSRVEKRLQPQLNLRKL